MARRPLIAVGFPAVAAAMKAKTAGLRAFEVVELLALTMRAGDEIPAEMRAAILDFAETYHLGQIAAGEILRERILAVLPAPPPPPRHAWQERRDLR